MLVGKGAEVNVLNIDGYSVLDVASNATKGNLHKNHDFSGE